MARGDIAVNWMLKCAVADTLCSLFVSSHLSCAGQKRRKMKNINFRNCGVLNVSHGCAFLASSRCWWWTTNHTERSFKRVNEDDPPSTLKTDESCLFGKQIDFEITSDLFINNSTEASPLRACPRLPMSSARFLTIFQSAFECLLTQLVNYTMNLNSIINLICRRHQLAGY